MSTELVVAATPDEIGELEPKARAELVTHALVESKQWLAVATKGTDPTPIAEFKAWAATVAEMTKQKGLAAEIQADALEMVRRAERGIGLAVRNGQGAGAIGTRADGGWTARLQDRETELKMTTDEIFTSNQQRTETYVMTDDVTDEQFEEALTEAREEGNLSRANVVRKIKGEPKPPAAERHELLRKTHHIKAERVIEETVSALEGLALGASLVANLEGLDADHAAHWADSMRASLRTLNKLVKELDRVSK